MALSFFPTWYFHAACFLFYFTYIFIVKSLKGFWRADTYKDFIFIKKKSQSDDTLHLDSLRRLLLRKEDSVISRRSICVYDKRKEKEKDEDDFKAICLGSKRTQQRDVGRKLVFRKLVINKSSLVHIWVAVGHLHTLQRRI